DETLFTQVRQPISFRVTASDVDGDTVSLNSVGLPEGATMTPKLPVDGNPISADFNWNPTVTQVGTYVINFIASDRFAQSQCRVTISVSACASHVVDFDVNDVGHEIAMGADVSGSALQNFGVLLSGASGATGSPGVFTNRQGPPGSE